VKRSLGEKQYELSNHLGNVLVTVSDRKLAEGTEGSTASGYRAEVLFASDYYPFGMQMPGREYSAEEYRYGYQGSEKDNEIAGEGNMYTTHFRALDTRIGRWLSVDPKASKNTWQSPYSSMDNNPVRNIDPFGDIVEYETRRDKVNSFFARLLSKSYRQTFRERNNNENVYTLMQREKNPSLRRLGTTINNGGGSYDWQYSMSSGGRDRPHREKRTWQVTIITISREEELKINAGKQSSTIRYYVPEGGELQYRTFQVPDNVKISDSKGNQVYESQYNSQTDNDNPSYSDFQGNNPNYHATNRDWIDTGISSEGEYTVDVNQDGIPQRNSGIDGNTIYEVRAKGGGEIKKERTKTVRREPQSDIIIRRK
jgi:RHS repeat-associated protein